MTVVVGVENSADELLRAVALKFGEGISPQTKGFDPHHQFRIRTTDDHTSPDRAQPMLEFSTVMTIKNPRNRLIYSKSIDIFNLVGLWFYMLRGTSQLRDIEFYNPLARKFTDEEISGDTLRANWGERIFSAGALQGIITLLSTYPNSRRAYLPVFSQEDIGVPSRNLPCLAGIQFLTVKGKLNMYVTMRAQAAIGVLPYDLFLLTMLQEYVALRVGIPLGDYTHFAPAFGIREREIATIMEIVDAIAHGEDTTPPEMLPMEELVAGRKSYLLDAERRIRMGGSDPDFSLLPSYWQGMLWVTRARRLFLDHNPQWDHALSKATTAFPADFLSGCLSRLSSQFVTVSR